MQVSISQEVNEKITKKAEEYGVTKSAFCAFVLGSYFDQMDTVTEQMNKTFENIVSGGQKK